MGDQEGQLTAELQPTSDSSHSQTLKASQPENPQADIPQDSEAIEQVKDIRVRISADGTEAFVNLSADPEEPYPFTAESITQALKGRGVVEGLLVDEIQQIVDQQRYGDHFLVAKGQKPVEGEDARIEYLFDSSPKPYAQDDVDRVDWRETNLIQRVVADQPVARKIPLREGTPGFTVTGGAIMPRKVRDVPVPVGKGTKIDENDPNVLLAEINGAVRLAVNRVVVDTVFSVPHDVDFSIGNINVDGGVHVGGNVMPGFQVRASGDVYVQGYVESATVEAGGSVSVDQGILGQDNKTTVRAGKDVHARFVTNALVQAGGDINIQRDVVNSHLESGGVVSSGSPEVMRGRIAGGEVTASTAIHAVHVGAESGTTTIINININLKAVSLYHRETNDLTEQVAQWRAKHEKVMAEVAKLLQMRTTGDGGWNESSAELLSKLGGAAKQIEEQVQAIESQLEQSKHKLDKLGEPKMVVRGTLYHGVRVTIGRATRSFHDKLHNVQVVLTDDHSRVITLSN